jgi:Beta propeller domain
MGRTGRAAMRAGLAVGVVAAVSAVFLVVPGGPGARPAAAAGLTPFADCAELESWFADAAAVTTASQGGGWMPFGGAERAVTAAGDSAAGAAEQAAPGGLDAGAVGPGATGTNVQEAGVDEPDLLKTNGDRLVVVRGERLHVLDVTGETPVELGSLALPPGAAGELLLSGDRALVLGTSWSAAPMLDQPLAEPAPDRATSSMVAPGTSSALLTVVDLADPTALTVVSTHEIEGGYVSAREHAGVVRVVLQSMPWRPFTSEQGTAAPAQDWLPQRIDRNGVGEVSATEPLLDCADVSRPSRPAGMGLVTVLTLDLNDPSTLDSVAVAADGNLVYASPARLYVATTRGGWTRPVEPDMWGGAEPQSLRTEVHAFDVTAATATTYVGSGEVEGWLLGRWAMSEYEGRLRVATTRGQPWGPGGDAPATDSAVTVLEEQGEELQIVGSVGGLGQGEQVRAVRWFGDVATVVTFRQTDPLYTIDLADPANPQVLGNLKVPGYSAYLHPLGDGLLLGVGQDATEQGQVLGTQVSTFDLSDLAAPQRIDTVVEPDSWSDVESDSRQFSYLPDARAAVLPVSGPTGSILLSFRVDEDGGLTEAGRWTPGRDGWVVRGLPVGGGRLAVLDEGSAGTRLTLVTVDGLGELGAVRLN